jgi:transcriptional regulator with XRE-family HTH domain
MFESGLVLVNHAMNNIWLSRRRTQIDITQGQLASKLTLSGHETSRTTVTGWEAGNPIPLADPQFVRALANALRMSALDVLIEAGYPIASDSHTEYGRRAADIVDQLPESKKRLALGILEQILEGD